MANEATTIGKAKKSIANEPIVAAKKRGDDARLAKYNQGIMPTGVTTSGTAAEKEGELAGFERAGLGYGQGLSQTGQDIQRIKELQQGRTSQSGADPVSAAIMGQKQGALANAQRGMSASGVKGGTAQGVMSNVEKEQNQNIAASLYGQQRQSIADERSLASNMLAGTEAMSQGGKATGTAQDMPKAPDVGGMGLGTVICTELHRQGIMPLDMYIKDMQYGESLDHVTLIGYRLLANPVVKLMHKYAIVTSIVSIPAMAWARNMAGQYNFFGSMISFFGEPICHIIGKVKLSFSGAKYV
jgi:hypothetical protein